MLDLPYSSDTAEDLVHPVPVVICVASLSRHPDLLASSPQQPYIFTVKGIQTQPKQLLFLSLAACLQSSAADAVDPTITLALFNAELFFNVMVKSSLPVCPTRNYGPRYLQGGYDFPLRLGHCLPRVNLQYRPAYTILRRCLTKNCVR